MTSTQVVGVVQPSQFFLGVLGAGVQHRLGSRFNGGLLRWAGLGVGQG